MTGDAQRVWIIRAAASGLILGIVISWPLWTNLGRSLPTAPVLGFLPPLPASLASVVTIGALGLFGLSVVWPRKTWPLGGGIGMLLGLAAFDQMRWQPWVWHYLLLLVPFALLRGKEGGGALVCAKITTVAFYFWAGFHKIGAPFQDFYRETLVRPWLEGASPPVSAVLRGAGFAIPAVEILIGLLLVLPLTWIRRGGVMLVAASHVGILGWLVLRGLNHVVWPWNIVAPMVAAVLFWPPRIASGKKRGKLSPSGGGRTTAVVAALVLLVCVLPLFSWTGRWDRALSFHLYSGRAQRVIIAFTPATNEQLPERVRRWSRPSKHWPGRRQIDLEDWSLRELRVAFFSEDRVVLVLCRKIFERYPFSPSESFVYRDYPKLEERGFSYLKPEQLKNLEKLPPLVKRGEGR